ncbi:MAG: hypothetical protein G5701_05965 [Serratia symbiotica]|nr:hypothetical protein [Serratia symbiotica]
MSWLNGELTPLSISLDSLYVVSHDAGNSKFVRIPVAELNKHQTIPVPSDEDMSAIFASSHSQDNGVTTIIY